MLKKPTKKTPTVGTNIKRMRNKRGLSQAKLADALHVRQPTLARMEKQEAVPDGLTLLRIAKALHCSMDEFFVGVDTEYDAIRNDLIRHGKGDDKHTPLIEGAHDARDVVVVGSREQYSELRIGLGPVQAALNEAFSALSALLVDHPLPAEREKQNPTSSAG